jgi:hypoxanthine phosphoribosyltransferase
MTALSWLQYHADILLLKEQLGNYRPDVIVPCMLGGLIPGAILAKSLGITDVRPIDIARKGAERWLAYDVQGDIAGKKVLIVEDDLPTGIGPVLIKKQFEQRGAEVKIASIYVTQTSKPLVDFFVRELEQPPDYPWKKGHAGDRLRQ